MRYFRVTWTEQGITRFSDPITTWTEAELYRREIGGDAAIISY